MRKRPVQINIRCSSAEKEAYAELADELNTTVADLIRTHLNRKVHKHLGKERLK